MRASENLVMNILRDPSKGSLTLPSRFVEETYRIDIWQMTCLTDRQLLSLIFHCVWLCIFSTCIFGTASSMVMRKKGWDIATGS